MSRHVARLRRASAVLILFLVSLIVASPAAARAQNGSTPAGPPAAVAMKVEQAPVLDGEILEDPAWQASIPVEGFWQTTPLEGARASERTEVRIVYTDSALYVGVVCYDRDPSGIIIADARRDSPLDNTDSVRFILDTYQDRQNGFVFGTNPAGIEYDAQVSNEGQGSGSGGFGGGRAQGGSGGGFNLNWDGSWRVRTRISAIGWSAEFEIPFRTLRYPDDPTHTWGLNVERRIRRRNEAAYWAPLPRQFDLNRLSLAGTLQGLEIPAQRNLTIIPYVLGEAREDAAVPDDGTLRGEPGIDLKYSVTPALTLDATYNTDFAQVEVDEQQINLDRFNLFFPEKRPFFLENAGLFSVGSPGEAEVFFSRRIGIGPDGQAIPIRGGARLSGHAGGGVSIGVLNMQTEAASDQPANNFTVARLRRELPNRSSVGAIFVNREATGGLALPDDRHRSMAIDARWGLGRTGLLSGFLARTGTPEEDGDGHAYQVAASRDTQAWLVSASYTDVGPGFSPEVGFLSRTGGFRKPDVLVFHRYRPQDFLRIQEIRPHVSYRGFWKPDGFHESGHLHVDSHWEFRSGHEVHTGVNLIREGVRESFEIAGVFVPAGTYDHREAQIVAFTNEGAPWGLRLRATVGGFFGGDRVALSPSFRLRLSEQFNAEVSLSRNDARLPTGRFTTNLARARLSYSFTPQTFVQGLLQYNDAADIWSVNVRFGWLHRASTGLFVVYNDTQYVDDVLLGSDGPRAGRSLVVKISRMIDVLR